MKKWNLEDEQITIGVVIPVYNGETYLAETVKSILVQPCVDLRVIIINDGSKDTSLSIAQYFAKQDSRVIVLNQNNSGVSVARNRGIEYCIAQKIKYIAFLDADDVWVDKFYTNDIRDYLVNQKSDVYRCFYYTGNEKLTRVCPQLVKKEERDVRKINKFSGHFCSYIYSVRVFEKYELAFPKEIRIHEDCVFQYVFLSTIDNISYINKAIFTYRSNSKSVLHSGRDVEKWYLGYIIPAWNWAEEELKRIQRNCSSIGEKDIQGCYVMKKTYLSEYIKMACQQGVAIKKIKRDLQKTEESQLFHKDIWVDDKSQKRWIEFQNNPYKVWIHNRFVGTIVSIGKCLRSIKYIEKKRYPIVLKSKRAGSIT